MVAKAEGKTAVKANKRVAARIAKESKESVSAKEWVGAVETAGTREGRRDEGTRERRRRAVMVRFYAGPRSGPHEPRQAGRRRCQISQKYFPLLAYIKNCPGNMVWLSPGVPQKSHEIQLVNAPNKPRVDLHPPFLILNLFPVLMSSPIRGRITGLLLVPGLEPLLSLSLENCSKTLVPVKNVYHPTRFQVSPEQDACIRQFPHCRYFNFRLV